MTEPVNGGLPKPVMAKIAFAMVGIAVFGIGIRYDNANVRWAGLGLVAVAWFLRFAKRPD